MLTSEFYTDVALVDYVRLATFDTIQFYNLTAAIERKFTGWHPQKHLQYKGRQSKEGVFHGLGDQNGRAHGIIQVSGLQAQIFLVWLFGLGKERFSSFYCTRIDIQVTKQRPHKEWRIGAYKRSQGGMSLIQSDTGITLYIGSRSSDSFWRLYDKTKDLLRVEVELKGKLAKRSWVALVQGEAITGIWNRHLLKSKVPSAYTSTYQQPVDPATLPLEEEVIHEDLEGKLNWLKQLDGMIWKLLNDHDLHERTATIINRWAEYVQKIDEKPDDTVQS